MEMVDGDGGGGGGNYDYAGTQAISPVIGACFFIVCFFVVVFGTDVDIISTR